MKTDRQEVVAMLLSCDSFEMFYEGVLGLDFDRYLSKYRNDFSWYYAKGLIENHISPILYIPSLRRSGIYETDVGVRVRFLPLASWYRPIAPLRRAFRATRWSLYLQERMNALAFQEPLREAMSEDGVDLLYVQEYWGGRFDHLAHRVDVPIAGADHGALAQGVVKWFKRPALRRAAAIYCQTSDECEQVERNGGIPTLQPNGCDTAFFRPPPPGTDRQKCILTVARLTDKQKRTSDLIRVLPFLSDDWSLSIVGTGPDRLMLEALARRLGVASRVTFHGFMDRDEVRRLGQSCGVFAMPSSNEAVCLAVLEAMGCGAAVVASDIRTFRFLLGEGSCGRLFPVGDLPALAQSIEAAFSDRKLLGEAALSSIHEQFDSQILYFNLAASLRQAMSLV